MREVIKSNLDRTRKNVVYILFKAASYNSACWHTSVNPAETEDKKLQHQLQDEILPYKEENKKGNGVEDEEEKEE